MNQSSEEPRIGVYVVDDESMIGEVVKTILELEGFDSASFVDPLAALESFRCSARKPALLLTDFLMVPLNGMELIQICKKEYPLLKTVLFSGNVGEEITHEYSVPPDAFLAKPFLPGQLVEKVRQILQPTCGSEAASG